VWVQKFLALSAFFSCLKKCLFALVENIINYSIEQYSNWYFLLYKIIEVIFMYNEN
jgi:CBS domain containing-hemolysin-like protein